MVEREDVIAGGIGAAKALASRFIPGVSEMLAGFDSYRSARFERETKEFLDCLHADLTRVDKKFDPAWFSTPDGERFAHKVLDCAIDAQLSDKKELFARALLNGAATPETELIEKFRFVDILRHLSLAALMVLADIHHSLAPDARGPGRTPPTNKPYPHVDPKRISEKLSPKYDPYVVESALCELQGQGLFSSTAEWSPQPDGSFRTGGGFSDALAYTDFTCRFVEFITIENERTSG